MSAKNAAHGMHVITKDKRYTTAADLTDGLQQVSAILLLYPRQAESRRRVVYILCVEYKYSRHVFAHTYKMYRHAAVDHKVGTAPTWHQHVLICMYATDSRGHMWVQQLVP